MIEQAFACDLGRCNAKWVRFSIHREIPACPFCGGRRVRCIRMGLI